jgi:prepilin-type N-terminal cleavage/methylation domain-containing protein
MNLFANNADRAGFTLTEVLISLGVGSLVLATVATMFVSTFHLWRHLSADLYLTGQARMIRERLLRGPDGRHGMREMTDDILIPSASHNSRIFYDAANGWDSSESCSVRGNPLSKESVWWHDKGKWTRINREAVRAGIRFPEYDEEERVLSCIVSNYYPIGSRTNWFIQSLEIPVLNEEE